MGAIGVCRLGGRHLLAQRRVAVRLSFIGVIVFTGLAAYDAQRLKAMALATPTGQTGSYAIVGALALYLDFINLFLFMLRFMGSRRGLTETQCRDSRIGGRRGATKHARGDAAGPHPASVPRAAGGRGVLVVGFGGVGGGGLCVRNCLR